MTEFDERDDKCVNCAEINPRQIKVKCCECPGELLLCLECFSCGVELGKHKRTHSYTFYDPGSFPLLTPDWCAADEIQLLESLEEFGFGDWEACNKYLENKTPREIHSHFEEFYLSGPIADAAREFLRDPALKPVVLSPGLTPLPPRVEISKVECEKLGYLPKRDDFEREYDNTAEELISKLVATHNDEPIEASLKFAQVQIYNKRLRDRERRKKLAREYGLVCPKQETAVLRGKKSDQKEMRAILQPVGRFTTFLQFDKLANMMTKCNNLREEIVELQMLRDNGITKLDDKHEYEIQQRKREKRKIDEKIGNTPPKRLSFNSLRTHESNVAPKTEKDIRDYTGFRNLTETEKELCVSLQMAPQKYLGAKMCLIKNNLSRDLGIGGGSSKSELSTLEKMRITEYLRSVGYIALAT